MMEKQFTYCPLIWTFCSKIDMQMVEKVEYKNLQVMNYNNMAAYDDLLVLDKKLKIHQRHLQFLAIEIYNSRNELNPRFCRNYRRR